MSNTRWLFCKLETKNPSKEKSIRQLGQPHEFIRKKGLGHGSWVCQTSGLNDDAI